MKKFIPLLIALTLAGGYAFKTFYSKPLKEIPPKAPAVATLLNPTKAMPSFSLQSTEGQTFTEKSFADHWTLMFFGYADCPAICPQTLTVLSKVWESLPEGFVEQHKLRLAFVSLDPSHDTLDTLRAFLTRFNPHFIGLTGEESVIQHLSKYNNIYSWQDPQAKEGVKLIDHSATLLLVNPQGQVQALFSPPHVQETIVQDLETLLKAS